MEIIQEMSQNNRYTVEFVVGRPYRNYPDGKAWPIVTQCIIKENNLVIGLGEVVKHAYDDHNAQYAIRYAAKKAFLKAPLWREMRERLWKKILAK